MMKRNLLLAAVSMGALCPARAGALKGSVESLDDIPEALHAEYVQQGDKYVLQVEGMKPETEFQRVQSALTKERQDHGALKTRISSTLGDRKFEEVATLLDRIPELEAAAEGKLDEDKINSIVEGRVRTKLAPVERERDQLKAQLGEKDKVIGEMTGKEKRRTIRDAVRAAAKSAKVTDEAIDDALLLGDNIFELRDDDGKVVVKDGVGYTPGIEPSVLFTDLQSKKPHWFGASMGGGAGGNREGIKGGTNPWSHAGWNMTEQGRIYNADPDKAKQLAKAAGHSDPLTARKPPAPQGK